MKFQLTRRLYDKGCGRDNIINLLKVIDWALIIIPENLELEYKEKLHKLEEEKNMPYMTSFERDGLIRKVYNKALQQGEKRKALAIARSLLNQNIPLAVIKSETGLSEQEIELEDA